MNNRNIAVINKIIGYCEDILKISADCDYEKFLSDKSKIWSCTFGLMQIGELVKELDESFKETNPEIPWAKMYGLRNKIAHNYDNIKNDVVWDIINLNIPELLKNLRTETKP